MERPEAGAGWFKAHGLGNDYLVFRAGEGWRVTPGAAAAVCHRWRGVGGDGIVLELPPLGGRFRLRMFNPDGSEFERSGNGLRVFAAALASEGRVGSDPFPVEVGGGEVVMQVRGREPGGILDVSVEMGRAQVASAAVPDRLALPGGGEVAVRRVWTGNPHCVVFTDDLSEEALQRLGPALAAHSAFPGGTNVQLARVEGPGRVRIAIWERGVGPTSASGTSSCAVAVAAVYEGRLLPGEVEVVMEGGTLGVTVSPELDVVLRGPVQEVGQGTLGEGFLEFLRGL